MSYLDTEIYVRFFIKFVFIFRLIETLTLRKLLKMLNYCNTGVPVSRFSIANVYQGKSFIYGSAHDKDQMYPKENVSVTLYGAA